MESNHRPPVYKTGTLPSELQRHNIKDADIVSLLGKLQIPRVPRGYLYVISTIRGYLDKSQAYNIYYTILRNVCQGVCENKY